MKEYRLYQKKKDNERYFFIQKKFRIRNFRFWLSVINLKKFIKDFFIYFLIQLGFGMLFGWIFGFFIPKMSAIEMVTSNGFFLSSIIIVFINSYRTSRESAIIDLLIDDRYIIIAIINDGIFKKLSQIYKSLIVPLNNYTNSRLLSFRKSDLHLVSGKRNIYYFGLSQIRLEKLEKLKSSIFNR